MKKLLLVVLLAGAGLQAFSYNAYFTGEGDGHSWNQKDNWRFGSLTGNHGFPSYGDTAIIDPGEGTELFLTTSNTVETTTWPCHHVYKFMSGTTYIDRKHTFYYHGGTDTAGPIPIPRSMSLTGRRSSSRIRSAPTTAGR